MRLTVVNTGLNIPIAQMRGVSGLEEETLASKVGHCCKEIFSWMASY